MGPIGSGQKPEGGGKTMRNYEMMFIINPTVMADGRDALLAKVEETLTKAGATELKTEKWGERKLAYPIEKKTSGFYVLTTFTIDGTNLTEVERKLNITEGLMRYIVVKKK